MIHAGCAIIIRNPLLLASSSSLCIKAAAAFWRSLEMVPFDNCRAKTMNFLLQLWVLFCALVVNVYTSALLACLVMWNVYSLDDYVRLHIYFWRKKLRFKENQHIWSWPAPESEIQFLKLKVYNLWLIGLVAWIENLPIGFFIGSSFVRLYQKLPIK